MNNPLYYLWLNNQQTGPYTFGQILAMWKSGTVTAQTQYWTEGQTEWEQLIAMADLFDKPASKMPIPQAVVKPAASSSKIKQRPKWWIVTTHVMTSGFAIPIVAVALGAVLIGVLGMEGIMAIFLVMLFNVAGYIGGTIYSLSYLKKNVTTSNWEGCTVPSICFAAFITFAAVIGYHPFPIANIIVSIIDLIAFGIITTNGFKELAANN
jgi:hypothetical protein